MPPPCPPSALPLAAAAAVAAFSRAAFPGLESALGQARAVPPTSPITVPTTPPAAAEFSAAGGGAAAWPVDFAAVADRPSVRASNLLASRSVAAPVLSAASDFVVGKVAASPAAGGGQLGALVAALPRDAHGIPVAGAHTASGSSLARVWGTDGSRQRVPMAALRAAAVELALDSRSAAAAAAASAAAGGVVVPQHATGVVASGVGPAILPSVRALARDMVMREDYMADMWRKEADSDDDDLVATAFDEGGSAKDTVTAVAGGMFEEAQLSLLLDSLEAHMGT